MSLHKASAAKTDVSKVAFLKAAELASEVIHAEPAALPMGDSASKAALKRLNEAVAGLRHQEMPKLLRRAIRCINLQEFADAEKLALTALKIDQRQGIAWHVLAIAREKQGDFGGSLRCYDAALKLLPEDTVIALDLGRLAARMSMPELAVKLYELYLAKNPNSIEAINNMASCLRDLTRYDEAIDLVKPTLTAHPENTMLWNTLGTIVKAKGDNATAIVFFDEALRLNPDFAIAYHNRGGARYEKGDLLDSLADCDAALERGKGLSDFANMEFSKSTTLLSLGRLREGWDLYEARLSRNHGDSARFVTNCARWSPSDNLEGKRLAIFGEQGIGDEILFLHTLRQVIDAVGPKGSVSVITSTRLKPLFERSFPEVEVLTHRTVRLEGRVTRGCLDIEDWGRFDFWTPAGSLLRTFRTSLDHYVEQGAYLQADPARVAHWRNWLATLPQGPKVGILWKSQKISGDRSRYYSPFEAWRSLLQTPGAVFINVQYGDCDEELAYARDVFGVEVIQPPQIDLKMDLDDLAALVTALDVIIGSPNATTQIAGAVGTPVWMISAKTVWSQLGTDYYPWFPQVRCFPTESTTDWTPVMDKVAAELARAVAGEIPFSRQA